MVNLVVAFVFISLLSPGFGRGEPSRRFPPIPKAAVIGGSALSAVVVLSSLGVGLPISIQYNTAADIPIAHIKQNRKFNARVAKVVDGDTIRVVHRRYPFSSGVLSKDRGQKLSTDSIVVRLAAVDAPETAKASSPGQPFAETASQFVSDKVLDKTITVKMLSKDRYGRLVGRVAYRDGVFGVFAPNTDLSMALLDRGLAVVYEGGGAQYDGRKAEYRATEVYAKKRKRGLWSRRDFESPAEYKRKVRMARGR